MRRTLALLLSLLLVGAAIPAWAAQPVRARHGMVVTRETHATEVGLKVLKTGGNAVDAAVAVGFALAVTHPSAGNIGGGGFMLVRMADGRTGIHRFPRARAAGGLAQHVPGRLRQGHPGQRDGLSRFGRARNRARPGIRVAEVRQEAMGGTGAPAVELASKGFALSYAQANGLQERGPGT